MAAAAGAGGRFDEFLTQIPVVTRALLVVNVAVHVVIFVFSLSLNTFAISAHLVLDDSEYYRIVSAAFVHAGLMHIFMNMSSLLQLGLSIEAHFGSLQFLFLTLWSIFAVGGLYVLLAVLFSYVDPGQMFSSGVGYSGVLFCYALIEAYHTTETTRSIFGMFSVPSRMYPFILLIILQVVIPNISFLGHGAGILVGLLVVHGGLNFLLPSTDFLVHLESTSPVFAPLTKASGYVRANNRSLVHATSSSASGACTGVVKMASDCLGHVMNVVSALLFIVGCPVERFASWYAAGLGSLRRLYDSVVNSTSNAGPAGPDGAVELGRYARVEGTDVEGGGGGVSKSTTTTTATAVV